MIYLSLITSRVKTYGSEDVETLIELLLNVQPAGNIRFKFVSLSGILRIEFANDFTETFVAVFTNIEPSLQPYVCTKVSNRITLQWPDLEVMTSEEEEVVDDVTTY